MKITKKIRICILSAALLVSVIFAAVAVSAYDGTSDPLVSLSYLEQFKTQQIDTQIRSLQSEITALESIVNQLLANGSVTPAPSAGSEKYTVLQLQYGQRVVCGESCEMILRAGSASVVLQPTSQGGISDLTGAKDLANGEAVAPNHLLLVPRADGRGLLVTSDIVFLMIKGEYTIE